MLVVLTSIASAIPVDHSEKSLEVSFWLLSSYILQWTRLILPRNERKGATTSSAPALGLSTAMIIVGRYVTTVTALMRFHQGRNIHQFVPQHNHQPPTKRFQ